MIAKQMASSDTRGLRRLLVESVVGRPLSAAAFVLLLRLLGCGDKGLSNENLR